jgi:hypothetical protein
MSCWFNPSSGGVDMILLSLGATSGNHDRIVLSRGASNSVLVQSVAGGTSTVGTGGTLTTSAWNHAAGVYESASKIAYTNGTPGTAETSSYTLSGVSELVIGARRSAGAYGIFANGLIAEVAVWSAALTADEIAALSDGFTPDQIRPQSLVFYAPLIRTLQDLRGGLTITATNSPTVAVHPRVIQ